MDPFELIEKGKVKRYFRATRKLTRVRLISHITQRAAGREPLFIEDSDYLSMLANIDGSVKNPKSALHEFFVIPEYS